MQYVQANIGRNTKGTDAPMTLGRWNEFVSEVANAIANAADRATSGQTLDYPANSIEVHRGMGTYGNVEESAHISLVWADFDIEHLREHLKDLADEFGQDCIALITSSELVFSS